MCRCVIDRRPVDNGGDRHLQVGTSLTDEERLTIASKSFNHESSAFPLRVNRVDDNLQSGPLKFALLRQPVLLILPEAGLTRFALEPPWLSCIRCKLTQPIPLGRHP